MFHHFFGEDSKQSFQFSYLTDTNSGPRLIYTSRWTSHWYEHHILMLLNIPLLIRTRLLDVYCHLCHQFLQYSIQKTRPLSNQLMENRLRHASGPVHANPAIRFIYRKRKTNVIVKCNTIVTTPHKMMTLNDKDTQMGQAIRIKKHVQIQSFDNYTRVISLAIRLRTLNILGNGLPEIQG